MRYGEKLRECRVSKGWSRPHLESIIFNRFKDEKTGITCDTIKSIELGVSVFPRDTTRAILGRVFPELAVWERENTPTYLKELAAHVLVK